MNLLTIIIILIFAIATLRGYRRGFIKSLASMASVILSIVLVNLCMPYVTDFLKTKTPVYEYITERMESAFAVQDTEDGQNRQDGGYGDPEGQYAADNGNAAAGLTDSGRQKQIIDGLPIPQALKNLLVENNTPQFYAQLAANTFAEYVPRYLANLTLAIVSFVVTWILVIAVTFLAVRALDLVAELPGIHGLNRVLGLMLGFLQGLIIVWVLFLLITLFIDTQAGKQLMAMIAESPFLDTLYKENILLDFLTNLLGRLG